MLVGCGFHCATDQWCAWVTLMSSRRSMCTKQEAGEDVFRRKADLDDLSRPTCSLRCRRSTHAPVRSAPDATVVQVSGRGLPPNEVHALGEVLSSAAVRGAHAVPAAHVRWRPTLGLPSMRWNSFGSRRSRSMDWISGLDVENCRGRSGAQARPNVSRGVGRLPISSSFTLYGRRDDFGGGVRGHKSGPRRPSRA